MESSDADGEGSAVWGMAAILHRDLARRARRRDGRSERLASACDRVVEPEPLARAPRLPPGLLVDGGASGRDLPVDPAPVGEQEVVARLAPDGLRGGPQR